MSDSLDQHLNESLRDAMLAYYLTHKVPGALKATISTADDLYAHWLLDVQVSQAVPTSPVACAISSLQQYITRIQLGLEPGYEQQGMTAQQGKFWREHLHSYPLWNASQQLRYHPANYLDPTLRRDKTDSFQQLENDLSQYRIQADTVVTAVQSYLARFEETANIRTINGYIDADLSNLHSGTCYFVGKSSSGNTYYWRSLDLSKRSGTVLLQEAWSDWKKINLSVSDATAEQSIRPVYFNSRLFFIWAECIKPTPSSSFKPARWDLEEKEHLADWINTHYVKFRLNFSYKNHDGSWSAPQACIEKYCATEDVNASTSELLKSITQTVAIVDDTHTPALFLSVLATSRKDPKQQDNFIGKFFQAVHIDQSFTITTVADGGSPERYSVLPDSDVAEEINRLLEPFDPSQKTKVQTILKGEAHSTNGYYSELLPDSARQFLALFAHKNQGNLQFKIAPTVEYTISITSQKIFEEEHHWNFEKNQARIKDTDSTQVFFDSNTHELVFSSSLSGGFQQPYTVTLKKPQGAIITLITHDALDDPTTTQLKLSKGSTISGVSTGLKTDFYALYFRNSTTQEEFPNAVHTADGALFTHVTAPANPDSLLLEGTFIEKDAFVNLYTHKHFHITLNRYGTFSTHEDKHNKLHSQNVLLIKKATVTTPHLRAFKHVIMSANFKDYPFTETINANSHRIINFQDTAHESLTGSSAELPAGHRVTTRIPVTQEQMTSGITLIHGVVTLEPETNGTNILGYALNTAALKLATPVTGPMLNQQLAPAIRRLESDRTGTAEFIDFSNSSPSLPAGIPATLRMNTCFAAKLVQAANISLEHLFSLTPQTWQEPALTPDGTAEGIDFRGAYGKYFWELFLYVPWLIAHRLNQEQQYVEAQTWISYLFDPGRAADAASNRPAFWGLRELAREERLPATPATIPTNWRHAHPCIFARRSTCFIWTSCSIAAMPTIVSSPRTA